MRKNLGISYPIMSTAFGSKARARSSMHRSQSSRGGRTLEGATRSSSSYAAANSLGCWRRTAECSSVRRSHSNTAWPMSWAILSCVEEGGMARRKWNAPNRGHTSTQPWHSRSTSLLWPLSSPLPPFAFIGYPVTAYSIAYDIYTLANERDSPLGWNAARDLETESGGHANLHGRMSSSSPLRFFLMRVYQARYELSIDRASVKRDYVYRARKELVERRNRSL
ncbi:hypothetical protein C8F04DRAFT_595122 [Mycena alexandri]|uniref:Uncharacterized protein n=1 Tax=Mycena alexandri TaxID=1745969 RepID=A0AAD6XDW4_9AGAR|nr:hypothetical protein C8F04DRAFT_595122 [Mycena alexandri]